MNVITPTAAHRTSTAAPTTGTTPLGRPKAGDGRVQVAEAKSKQKYAGIAANDKKFEDFATALTGKTAEQRTPDENRALAQLRKEMADGTIDPIFVEADPANGPGDDKLPPGARGAFVRGEKGAQGRVLISATLRGQQLQKTSDEEQGEAVSDRARQLGIGVADGDAGARVSGVANGKQVTRQSDAALFQDQKSDTITVIANGKPTVAEAAAGSDGTIYNLTNIYDLENAEKRISYLSQFDKNGDDRLDRHELALALQTNHDHAERFIRIYGDGETPGDFAIPIKNTERDGIGVDDMIADGTLAPNPDKTIPELWTNLYNVKPETMALATLRVGAARIKSGGDTRRYTEILKDVMQNGVKADNMSWSVVWISGDKRSMDDKAAEKIAVFFGMTGPDQKTKFINFDGMLQIWQQGALRVAQDHPKFGRAFVSISADFDKRPVAPADDQVSSDIKRVTRNWIFGTLYFTDLMLPEAAIEGPKTAFGEYRPPYVQRSDNKIYAYDRNDYAISGDEMRRTVERDASGTPTGNVVWEFYGTQKNASDTTHVTFTVKAGSARDRYLLDFKEFASMQSETDRDANRPTPNVTKSGEVVSTSSGSKLEIWTPREHQFITAGPKSKAVERANQPIITVNGERATIQSIQRVKLANVAGYSYTVTVKTANGRTETFVHSPKTAPEAAAFRNTDISLNGGKESAVINLGAMHAQVASVLAGETVSGSGIIYFHPEREVSPERATQIDSKLSAFLGWPVTAADIPALIKGGHIEFRKSDTQQGYIVHVPNKIPAGENPWPNLSEEEFLRDNPSKLPPGKTAADIFPLYQRPNLLDPIKPGQEKKEIIPHRGVFTLGKGVPENSLKSITAAIGPDKNGKYNHSSTEVDIMYTKDGHAILAHDTTPGRVLAAYRYADGSAKLFRDASGKLRPYRWSDLTLEQVQSNPMIINEQDPNTGKFTGRYVETDQKIPSLKEALDHAIKINKDATVFLDARAQDAGKAIAWLAMNPQYKGRVAVKTYAYQYDNAAVVLKQVDDIIDATAGLTPAEKAKLKVRARNEVDIVPVLTADQTDRLAKKSLPPRTNPTDEQRTAAGIAWFKSFDDAKMKVAAREIPIETIGEYYNPVTKKIEAKPRRRGSPLPPLTAEEVKRVNEDKSEMKNLLDMFEGDSAQIDIFSYFNKNDPKTPVMQSYRSDDYETSGGIYGIYDWQTGLPVDLIPGLPSLGRSYRATPGALSHYGDWFITDRPLEEKAYLADQKDGKDDIVETRENPSLDLDPNENLSRETKDAVAGLVREIMGGGGRAV